LETGDGADDDDDDDDDDDSWGRRQQPPQDGQLPPNQLMDDVEEPHPAPAQAVPSTDASQQQSSSTLNSLHSRPVPVDNQQCFRQNYAAFSATCRNAIASQWADVQAKRGSAVANPPTADEAYSMMAPPDVSTSSKYAKYQKMNRALFVICIALFVCAALTCLCCCCKKMKKRRAIRRVAAEENVVPEVALSPLPEAVVVPNAGPTRFVPLATPVSVPQPVRPAVAAYVPYTGKGLAAYGQPVNAAYA